MVRLFFIFMSLVALVVIGLIGFTLIAGVEKDEIAVPAAVGRNFEEVAAELKTLRLVPEAVPEYGPDTAAGQVMRQSPAAGSKVKAGRRVRLFVCAGAGQVTVPDLVGTNAADALSRLQQVGRESGIFEGLRVGTQTSVPVDSPAGTILSQSPAAGMIVRAGTAIDIQFAADKGADTTMPSLVGMNVEEARERIARLGFTVADVERHPNPRFSEGTVTAQSPSPGARLSGAEIRLVVAGAESAFAGVEMSDTLPIPGIEYPGTAYPVMPKEPPPATTKELP